jgi:hypothetical protein
MSDEETASSPRSFRTRVFWWALLVAATAVVVGTLLLMTFTGAGNWLTVIGSSCTVAVSIIQLVAGRKRETQRS